MVGIKKRQAYYDKNNLHLTDKKFENLNQSQRS